MVICDDGSYYVGVTNDVERRVAEHNYGLDPRSYTFKRRPVELVYCAEFGEVDDATLWEKQIKGWSRAKKAALIRGDFEKIRRLAGSRASS